MGITKVVGNTLIYLDLRLFSLWNGDHPTRKGAAAWRRLEAARQATTLGEPIQMYLEDLRERAESGAKRGKRSGYVSAKSRLERHVLPKLGGKRLRSITVEQVSRLHRSMKDTSIEANRTLTALSAVFGYADHLELVPAPVNPCRHVERFDENRERRALSPEELKALGKALNEAEQNGEVHPSALLALRLFALTGLRHSEVFGHESRLRRGDSEGLRWGEVDLDAGTVRLRHTFASVGAHVQSGRYAAFVGPLLGHGYQKQSITERYIHSNPEALRPAADAIAEAIANSLGLTEPGRVLAFKA